MTMKTSLLISIAVLVSAGCNKPGTDKPTASADPAGSATSSGSTRAGASGSGSATPGGRSIAADSSSDDQDHIVVLAKHRPAKQSDPVRVRFDKFRVVKASFDPKKIEGGTATIEIDLVSLKSGNGERDKDLESPAYIDVGKFATVTIDVTNVKKTADKAFAADAIVKLRDVTKTYPVTFEMIEQTDDHVRIKGEHTFSRLDFSVGTDPATDSMQQVDTELTIEMVVTLKSS